MSTLLKKIKCTSHNHNYLYEGFMKCERCIDCSRTDPQLKTTLNLIEIWYKNNLLLNDYSFYQKRMVKWLCMVMGVECHEQFFTRLDILHTYLKQKCKLKFQ